jgi:hypothetical protein
MGKNLMMLQSGLILLKNMKYGKEVRDQRTSLIQIPVICLYMRYNFERITYF